MPHEEQNTPELISAVLDYYGADCSHVSATGWRTIQCPFHNDRHPSARINIAKDGFWCPVCGISADPIKLIELREGLNFREACEFAEATFGASGHNVSRTTSEPKRRKRWRSSLFD